MAVRSEAFLLSMSMPSVLAILAEGFEEIEAIAPIDLLRRAGVEVTVVSLEESLNVKGRSGIVVNAEKSLASVIEQPFDCLFFPGGPHVKLLRADARIRPLTQRYLSEKKWVAAICAAPTIINDAGGLVGKNYTAHFSVVDELKNILPGLRVVRDGRIITSRGAGTSVDFGLAMVEALVSPAKASDIAMAICL